MFEYDKDALDSDETEVFVVGLGCFWGIEAKFGSLDGVVRTSCGYAGGSEDNPTYKNIKDHTEVVRVEYDPEAVDYRDLVLHAMNLHSPKSVNRKRQYDNIIFYNNQTEEDILYDVIESEGYEVEDVETRLESLGSYYYAEDYHQKYKLRSRRSLENQFTKSYNEKEFRHSSLATKMNAFVSGELTESDFSVPDEIDLERDIFDRIADKFIILA